MQDAYRRTLAAYPAQMTYDVVRITNAALAMTAQFASILSGDHRNMEPVHPILYRVRRLRADCEPRIAL